MINSNPVSPCGKLAFSIKFSQVSNYFHQNFLGCVFRIPPIPQHGKSEPEPWLDQGSDEGLERRLVAGYCP